LDVDCLTSRSSGSSPIPIATGRAQTGVDVHNEDLTLQQVLALLEGKSLPEKLTTLRRRFRWSHRRLAREVGVAFDTALRWERGSISINGDRRPPSIPGLALLARFAEIFSVPLSALVGEVKTNSCFSKYAVTAVKLGHASRKTSRYGTTRANLQAAREGLDVSGNRAPARGHAAVGSLRVPEYDRPSAQNSQAARSDLRQLCDGHSAAM
jgi:transcriptional regulator with XRE-family HTH domain